MQNKNKGLMVSVSRVMSDKPLKAITEHIFFEDVEEGKLFIKNNKNKVMNSYFANLVNKKEKSNA